MSQAFDDNTFSYLGNLINLFPKFYANLLFSMTHYDDRMCYFIAAKEKDINILEPPISYSDISYKFVLY